MKQEELENYISLLNKRRDKRFGNNIKELKEELKKEFNIEVSENELMNVFEPTIEEQFIDNQLIYSNL